MRDRGTCSEIFMSIYSIWLGVNKSVYVVLKGYKYNQNEKYIACFYVMKSKRNKLTELIQDFSVINHFEFAIISA